MRSDDRMLLKDADVAFDVWYYINLLDVVFVGCVFIFIIIFTMLNVDGMRDHGYRNFIKMVGMSGLFIIGVLLLYVMMMRFVWKKIDSGILNTKDDVRSHEYTIMAVIFVVFLYVGMAYSMMHMDYSFHYNNGKRYV